MKIRTKIIMVVLPLILVALVLVGWSSYLAATNGISLLAKNSLGFKASELEKNANSQWMNLVQGNFLDRPDKDIFINATIAGIENYARSIIQSDTELIFAVDENASITIKTKEIEISDTEKKVLQKYFNETELINPVIGGIERVAKVFYFEPLKWHFFVTEERNIFYALLDEITLRTIIILIAAALFSIILLLAFSGYLTNPITKIVNAMKDIIITNDLSARVTVEYHDETGQLAHTFNIMIGELEKAYNQIKSYAFKSALSQKKEQKMRTTFQKYVPQELIDKFIKNPEEMLIGDNRVVSILFSDIRGFTTISESMMPDDLVNNLNRYFSIMVDVIMNHKGIIDKYIGDAIMAFFGAPVKHEDDALQSVLAGIDMNTALIDFNKKQVEMGKPEFHIGIGINYGVVTVGNIGTEKKMDYTVIGDNVNLASRLEGQTKEYKQGLIISESLHYKVKDNVRARFLDMIEVKGKTKGVKIFTVTKNYISKNQEKAWGIHNKGMQLYYTKQFELAKKHFIKVKEYLPEDIVSTLFIERCDNLIANPPPDNWDGVVKKETK